METNSYKLKRAKRIADHLKVLRNLERLVIQDPDLRYQTLQVNYGRPFLGYKLGQMITNAKSQLSQELREIK